MRKEPLNVGVNSNSLFLWLVEDILIILVPTLYIKSSDRLHCLSFLFPCQELFSASHIPPFLYQPYFHLLGLNQICSVRRGVVMPRVAKADLQDLTDSVIDKLLQISPVFFLKQTSLGKASAIYTIISLPE